MELELDIKKCEFNSFKKNLKILVIGKRGCGSTSVMKNITRYYLDNEKIHSTIIISSDNDWEKFYPEKNPQIISTCLNDEECIEQVWHKQKERIKKNRLHRLLFVIDHYTDYKDKNALTDILMNSRHFNTTLILGMSYSSLKPYLRTSIDVVFLCRESNTTNMKKLYNHYGGMFPSFDIFHKTMNNLTKNYMTMVINSDKHPINTTSKEMIENTTSWFKARRYKQFNHDDWNNMITLLNESPLWSKLHKDIKKHMINYFYEYSF